MDIVTIGRSDRIIVEMTLSVPSGAPVAIASKKVWQKLVRLMEMLTVGPIRPRCLHCRSIGKNTSKASEDQHVS